MRGRPFELISVSADDEIETVVDFLEDTPMPWVQWFVGSEHESKETYGVLAMPTYVLIDADGIIRQKTGSLGEEVKSLARELVAQVEAATR